MEKLLSVIIPVYNGEKYIKRCLDSVLQQTYKLLEIIIINDGSNDDSFDILTNYKNIDDRIILINQDNQGTSKTRNNALCLAKGKYITFVDIDDYLEKNTYETVMSRMDEDIDIISFGATCDFEIENYSINKVLENSCDRKYIIDELFKSGLFNPLWNKIYNAELIKNKIFFPKDINQGEDLIFNCLAYSNAIRIQNIEFIGYHYVYKKAETMISKYTVNNEIVLEEKNKYVRSLLIDSIQTYYDYMLKEYEVFVINLYFKGSPYRFCDKVKLVDNYILKNYEVIHKANAYGIYSKIFRSCALTNNAYIICIVYGLLNFLKKTLGNTYLKVRKVIYKG